MKSKEEIRKFFLNKRKKYTNEFVRQQSELICEYFFSNIQLSQNLVVHSFITIEKNNEPDTTIIWKKIWDLYPTINICVPRIIQNSFEMEHLIVNSKTEYSINKLGIKEPIEGKLINPALIDIVLVPSILIDTKGHRIGYGKGYYDRFLTKCNPKCLKIGITFEDMVLASTFETNTWDMALNASISPYGYMKFTH
ncbi:MAG: 5-formyltetrahydrofolate cyclo-ligase [Bacteroidota bacterium]|nr:5-formyltetrahydrofolate cyclo-ligase [Bacteroidota bacterium]